MCLDEASFFNEDRTWGVVTAMEVIADGKCSESYRRADEDREKDPELGQARLRPRVGAGCPHSASFGKL